MSAEDDAHQKAETFWTVAELEKQGVTAGEPVDLDLDFRPGESADAQTAIRALKMFGYSAETASDGGLSITVPEVPFTAEDIWLHEERCTTIVRERGFLPDGWGFSA
ncbi:hypothetical protein [Algicella marina]|uniref:Uncharacterized protein n=1 Tax=Algicella marina TaxID=2683284 RepID=A0A6P1SYS5_9RHOB|nr:hypothetical protein [Algicella marina]QHQ35628.1 hypothetical protein GO499_10785 [Algicella marina]